MSDLISDIRNTCFQRVIHSLFQPGKAGAKSGINKTIGPEKKIAFYCSSESYSGIEINILQLIEWLGEQGIKIILLASVESPIAKAAKEKNFDIVYIETNIRYFDLKNARTVARLLRKLKVKLLFISTTRDIDLGSLVKGFFYRKLKLVYLQQMLLEVSKRDFLHTLRYRQYDAWVIPLSYLSEQIKMQTHFNVKRLHVIPFCLNVKSIQQNKVSQLEARHRLDLPPARKIIGVIGYIDPQKKQDLLVRITKYLKTNNYEIDALIVGVPFKEEGNNYYEFLVKMTRDYKLERNIHFRPFPADENLFYRAIDIFTVITPEETTGMQTIKALANGTPVIAMDIGSSKEILENDNIGLLYRADDFGDFATKIIHLLTQEKTVKHMRQESMKTALLKYDKSVECSKMEELIKQLIK